MTKKEISQIQEKRVAAILDGQTVFGSGCIDFYKGDVYKDNIFIECKTNEVPRKSISVKQEWIDKAKEQAFSMRKENYVIAISLDTKNDYILMPIDYFNELLGEE
jgi:CTP:phosphocholine cytidylyltransferase-like protein